MKVLFDARYIRTDFHDGISRYSTELAAALHAMQPCVFLICDEKQRQFLPDTAETILMHAPTSAKEPFTALILNKLRPDVVFSPMQTMGSFGKKFKLILTVHDLIYFSHPKPPQQFSWLVKIGWRIYHSTYLFQKRVLRGADAVVTVSRTTENAMITAGMNQRPITVVPNAVAPSNQKVQSFKGPIENIVYMGSFMPYKNVESLLRALRFLPGKTLHLLSKISPARKKELLQLVDENASVVFHSGVTDEKYRTILEQKAILVNASLNEGYGLPLAEALSIGVPMAVSDIAIFHEVAGDGAVYFDPQNPEAIAQAITSLDTPAHRAAVRAAGARHAQKSSWQKLAKRLQALIKSLV